MGRKQVYASAADRQRAYRERMKQPPAAGMTTLEQEIVQHVERYALYWHENIQRHYRANPRHDFQLVFESYGAGKGAHRGGDVLLDGKYWNKIESAGALYLLRTGRLLLTTRRHWDKEVYVFRDCYNVTLYTLRNEALR